MIRKDRRVVLKATRAQAATWRAAAEQQGISLSEFVRQAVAQRLGWEPDPSQIRAPLTFGSHSERPAA